MRTHLVIPDTQIKTGVSIKYLAWIGGLLQSVRPDVIVQLGDWYDLHSLSSYDKHTSRSEGRRLANDIDIGNAAISHLDSYINFPTRKVFLIGNHEQRLERFCADNPELEDLLGYDMFTFHTLGWEVHDFLKVVCIDGISYSHFFPASSTGRVLQTTRGAPSARAMVIRHGSSCTAGHTQGLDYHSQIFYNRTQHGLIAGSCYLHSEPYLSPQGNSHWRGVVVCSNVRTGDYDLAAYRLETLRKRYG